jgi:quercetin dioxygenase-like cupin family protein
MPTAPKSEILHFLTLAEYQTDAVASRQISKAEGGNVSLFVFTEGQELSEHTNPYDALVHILDGKAKIIISGKYYFLTAGEGIHMPANEPHAVKAQSRFKTLLTMIHA